jgi:hypothetical protein
VLYYAHYYLDSHRIKKESEGFVTQAVSAIANDWSPANFNKYADDTLKSQKETSAMLTSYRKLGKLNQPVNCSMQDFTTYKYKETSAVYVAATYQCSAEFEKAPATIQLTIYRLSDKDAWKINSFTLNSSYIAATKR